ncbi:MAG TPA: cytochrome c biogenesis protein CcsA [Phycisphaerae bacterium]|nr:cytochrome c biogenesis protein CcsA [Phycisphaerae bacterium]
MTPLVAILTAMTWLASESPADRLPQYMDLDTLRGITVLHDGRWPPLDTLARDVVESVTGRAFFQGRDPVLWLLAWTFDPDVWRKEPLIPIRNAELRAELGLPADKMVFSIEELLLHERFQSLVHQVTYMEGGKKLDPLQAKVRDISEKLHLLNSVFLGQVIRAVPHPEDGTAAWKLLGLGPPHGRPDAEPANAAWMELRRAFLAGDAAPFATASSRLRAALDDLPAAYRPTPELIATELSYNRLRPFRLAWIVMAAGAIFAALATLTGNNRLGVLAAIALVAGFAVLTWGLWLRWTIAGRIPAANMFESLLFLSWGMGAFAILSMLLIRDRVVPLTASFMGALALLLAENLPLDHYIRPIAPVLMDTVWMSIHVPIIMVSYSVLALAALIAHVQLVTMAAAPARVKLIATIDSLHYWYVSVGCILLGAGIMTGSMWAASSWGRYWGWDPKEVWSLVAFLAYLAILHRRADKESPPGWVYLVGLFLGAAVLMIMSFKIAPQSALGLAALAVAGGSIPLFAFSRGPFATALKSLLAFWLIIMTYVGVNYVLGIGLHSYGFGTGAVVRYMFFIGGIDLAFVLLCTAVFLGRRQPLPLR